MVVHAIVAIAGPRNVPFCDAAYQKGGYYVGEVNFEFVFHVFKPFLSFKITPHLSKLIKAFTFYN